MTHYCNYLLALAKIKIQQKISNPPSTPPPYVKKIPLSPKEILYLDSNFIHLQEIFIRKCLTESIFLTYSPTPLDSMYKLYECIMFEQMNAAKAEIKYFYSRSDWTLSTIPDPRDYANLERYAVLTCIAYLLADIFHSRNGLRAHNNSTPSSIPSQEVAEMRKKERQLDKIPTWAAKMPLIKEPLIVSFSQEDDRYYQLCSGWLNKSESSVFRKVAIRVIDPVRWRPYTLASTRYIDRVFPENG